MMSFLWRWTKRLLLGGSCLVLGLIMIGLTYQRVATWRDLRRNPPPGKMIPVGDYRLHLLVRGEGKATVVFDSVLGASALSWALVQPEVAQGATACAFDRAGYGWSDPGPAPRSSSRLVTEMHTMLEKSGLSKPYVLVGASLGGTNVRLYAFRYPQEVAALVLVDPAHEDQFQRMPNSSREPLLGLRLFQAAARLGILRLAGMPVDVAGMKVLPAPQQDAANAVGYRTDAVDAIYGEMAAIDQSFLDVRQARIQAGPIPLGNKPLVVLTHQEAQPLQGEEALDYQIVVQLHQQLAAESSRGRQEVVEKSGHFIAIDQPQRVVKAIKTVLDEIARVP